MISMGDNGLDFNYWIISFFLIIFVSLVLIRKNSFNKYSLLLFIAYTILFIVFKSSNNGILFKFILIHAVASTVHLLISLTINIIFAKKKLQ